MIDWHIDWEQFEKSKLLNQITAQLNQTEEAYNLKVKELLVNRFSAAFTDEHERRYRFGSTLHACESRFIHCSK